MQALWSIVAIWGAVNLLFALWIALLWLTTNRRLTRGAEGLIASAAPYTCGSGTTAILLIHGFADTPAAWRRVAKRLAEAHGFTVRAMRLPGMGAPLSEARKQTVKSWLEAIETEVNALRACHGGVWIAGHSLGGALALLVAERGRVNVDGVALWAPYLAMHPKTDRKLPLLRAEAWYKLQCALLALPLSDTFFPFLRHAEGDPPESYTVEKVIARPLFGALFEAARRARAIHAWPRGIPLFMLLAGDDTIVDNAVTERHLLSWTGPQCILTEAGARHPLPQGEHWKRATDAMARFIANHPGAKGTA